MNDDPTRALDLTIEIDATLEEVWEALTTGEGIARWFGPYAAVTPGEGGSVSVVEREGMKETHGMGIWLSLYGLPEATAAPLRQALQT